MNRILFASSEAYPLIKTGGLADVAGSLPRALLSQKQDLRLILPAYTDLMARVKKYRPLIEFTIDNHTVKLLETTLPGTKVKTWLVDCSDYFTRPGNPYMDKHNKAWPDNAERFNLFCKVIERVAMNRLDLDWQPDIVHCNDWQTGLVPALLAQYAQRPATLFTIHNLAYQGLFDYDTFKRLDLPAHFWHHESLEFHGQFSFIKGGLVYADSINTVSSSYAQEIQQPAFGCGLEGLLSHRREQLYGILNGIDTNEWNPGTDKNLHKTYNRQTLTNKQINKTALQKYFKLPQKKDRLLIGFIGRMVEQKGLDDIILALPELVNLPLQLVFLGSGQAIYEKALSDWAQQYPDMIALQTGYDEKLAHQIEAGSDAFLMPSKFEPCGLNQMYSLRYGTLPIVTRVGGLADTITNINPETLANDSANGIVLSENESLLQAIQRLLIIYKEKKTWGQIQLCAMRQDHSWHHSAQSYLELYSVTIGRKPRPVIGN
ncbi:MAG: glycogen synthase GlgA [Gammaproteobacteria bacterium]|nr:glycogen synthase GlgA [Gammaproteobacteria bacterium]